MDVFKELEKLRQRHYECEDCWYSCPKSDEGCCDERYSKDECNCGADEQNKILDGIIEYLRLTQRETDG